MFKIAICVRNRLGITKKCIDAIRKHTKGEYEIYIYDNLTNYRLNDHFNYFNKLFQKNIIQQYVVNSNISTFHAFSKVVALNQFGYHHLMDPNKNKYEFLLFLDNDMIVMPDWDIYVSKVWKLIKNLNEKNIQIVNQYPGGMKFVKQHSIKIDNSKTFTGKLGGSGFWAVHTNFFENVGFLKCNNFINQNKKHDQMYWRQLDSYSRGQNYILGIDKKIVLHAGGIAGSVCNCLTKMKDETKYDKIKFKEIDAKIEKISFDDFFNEIKNKNKLFKW